MNEKPDSQFLERIRGGDQQAFTELVRRHQKAIHGLAFHLTRDASAAEDITQETFLRGFPSITMTAFASG